MQKTVFITGCSSVIGKATTKYFAAKGWNVAATMRNPSKETELNHLSNVKLFAVDCVKSWITFKIRHSFSPFIRNGASGFGLGIKTNHYSLTDTLHLICFKVNQLLQ